VLRYLLHLPRDHGQDPDRRWPVILFLHGAGERGADLEIVKRHGVARVVDEADDFPFITVSPQCPAGSYWYLQLTALRGLLDEVMAHQAAHPDRVYLTGLSMGGYGAWHLGAKHPDRFAAVVPVCGGGLASRGFPDKVCALKDVPVWAFHGSDDDIVPLSESVRLVERLRGCGGKVELTVYPGVGHDSWTRTFANPRVFEWMLEHRLSDRRSG
jgi:predicted peptidase